VVVPRTLEDEERRRLRQIVDYMKPAHTPTSCGSSNRCRPRSSTTSSLGLSELGDTFILH